jgi:Tumour protein p53-inducible protein 11
LSSAEGNGSAAGDAGEVPASLRAWFVVHAIVDVAIALPLLAFPEELLPRLGWRAVDPVSARLVAAALMAIGVRSWSGRHAGASVFREMLALKVIWSGTAIVGLTLAIARGAPPLAFLLLAIFLGFCGVWSHHALRFRQYARAPADEPESDERSVGDPPD